MRLLFSLHLVIVASLAAQSPYERLVMRTYGTNDGLPVSNVTSITHDSAGVVWVGTDRGIVGSTEEGFVVDKAFSFGFFLRGTVRMAPSKARNGFVFVSQGGDAREVNFGFVYGLEGYTLREVFPEWSPDTARSVPFTAITATTREELVLGAAHGGLWIRGLPQGRNPRETWAFRGLPITHIPFAGGVTALSCDSSGTVWVGSDRGLFRIGHDRCVPFEQGVLRSAPITALRTASDGSLLVGTRQGAYRVVDGAVVRMTAVGGAWITAMTEATNGDLWFGTTSNGVIRVRGEAASVFGMLQGLPSNTIQAMDADAAGNVWVGSDRGVTKIASRVVYEYAAGRDIPDAGWSSGLLARDGSKWFGGTGMLVRFSGFEPRVIHAPEAMRALTFRQLVEAADGSVWILTAKGVVRYDGRGFHLFKDDSAKAGDDLFLAVMAHDDRVGPAILWKHCIRRLENGEFRTIYTNPGQRPLQDCAYDRDGNLWFTSWTDCGRVTPDGTVIMAPVIRNGQRILTLSDSSVAVVDGVFGVVLQRELESVGGDSVPTSWQRRIDTRYVSPFEDGFVTSNGRRFGIVYFTSIREQTAPGQNFEPHSLEHYAFVELVTPRADGRMLFVLTRGTRRQLTSFDPNDGLMTPEPFLNSLLTPYLYADDATLYRGVPETRSKRSFEDANGTLWWASSVGILAIPPAKQVGALQPPALRSVTAGDSRFLPGFISSDDAVSNTNPWWKGEVRGHLAGFSDGFRFTIPSEDNDLEITVALHTPPPHVEALFQGRLDGRDTAWSEATIDPDFRYRDLAQGNYRFRVRTVTASGVASAERTVVITLITPFWRASWFITIVALTAAYVATRLTGQRFRRLKEEHTRLTKQAVQENELRMARAVQLGMLPERAPDLPGFEIAARSIPAAEVGGDFYDFIQDGQRIGIAVGDVSGHGITGAMIVGMARTSLRFASSRFERPSRVLTLANDRLRQDISRNAFIAMFYGLLDPNKRSLRYICAGQPTPVLIRDGKAEFLPRGKGDRFPLGIMPRVSYREEELSLKRGDVLVLYTDGFVEAMNAAREEFGFDRFLNTLGANAHRNPSDLIAGVVAEVQAHAGGAPQEDDMTMVVFRVRKEARR